MGVEVRRVMLFTSSLGTGGAQRVMVRLASGLAEQGVAVELVVARGGPFAAELSPRVSLVELGVPRIAAALPALVRRLRHSRPQVLVSALDYVNAVAWAAARLADPSMPLVLTEHNTPSALIDQTTSCRGRLATRWLLPFVYPRAERVVAVSRGAREDLIRNFDLAPEQVETIQNPVLTPELLRDAQRGSGHPWLAPGQPPLLVTAGRLEPQKDHALLLEAFARLAARRDGRLLVLGEGPLRASLEEDIRRRGLEDRVRVPGFVADPFPLLREAALFVLSSRCEGLPTVLIEALALGTPIVSTDCPSGPREILDGGRHGRLVPMGDAAALASAMEASLDATRPAVPDEAWRLYDTKVCVERYLELLQRVLAERSA